MREENHPPKDASRVERDTQIVRMPTLSAAMLDADIPVHHADLTPPSGSVSYDERVRTPPARTHNLTALGMAAVAMDSTEARTERVRCTAYGRWETNCWVGCCVGCLSRGRGPTAAASSAPLGMFSMPSWVDSVV